VVESTPEPEVLDPVAVAETVTLGTVVAVSGLPEVLELESTAFSFSNASPL
jgi:hypothetical protein